MAAERKRTGQILRTTIYLAPDLARALKRLAAERQRPVNTLLVEAAETLVLAHEADGARAGADQAEATGLSLRRDLDQLALRVAVLEARAQGRATVASPDGERHLLDAAGVRREARLLINARGAPIPHRELLGLLERHFVLPGKNPSENLRTILVHPKARGFAFVASQGYAVT